MDRKTVQVSSTAKCGQTYCRWFEMVISRVPTCIKIMVFYYIIKWLYHQAVRLYKN